MKPGLVVVIFILLNQSVIHAETDTIPHIFTGFQAHYGFIIPHSESIRNVSHTKPYGIEISRCKFRTSPGDWKVFNSYWISGIKAGYFNFQYPKVLGYTLAISVFAEPVIISGEKYFFTIKGGGGLSYHSKIYDQTDNPLNMFFSSRISLPVYVTAGFKYRISDKTFVTLSGSYNHVSNGGYKQPNKGMNFPTVALGLEHFQKTPPVWDSKYIAYKEVRKPGMFLTIQALTTIRVIGKEGAFPQRECFIYGLNSRVTKPLGPIYALNAGAELICDRYIRESLRRKNINTDYKRFALTLGQEFTFGKVIFTQYFGYYLYSPNEARNPIYQKYELSYNIIKIFSLGIYIKSHAQVAESTGITFNYKFVLSDQM
jgi:hypothetical protein